QVPLLWQHRSAEPIGKLLLSDSHQGLKASGKLVLSIARAQEAYDLLREKIIRGLSIGFTAINAVEDGAVRRLTEIRLFEGSLVTFPANTHALVASVKTADGPHSRLSELLTEWKDSYRWPSGDSAHLGGSR